MNKQANYIFEYHDAITSGRIRAGKWIKAIYKILVEGIKNGEWVFDQKKANKAIKFIENYCHHSAGAIAWQGSTFPERRTLRPLHSLSKRAGRTMLLQNSSCRRNASKWRSTKKMFRTTFLNSKAS